MILQLQSPCLNLKEKLLAELDRKQWAAECDDLPSGESNMTDAEYDDIEDPNFVLVSVEYSDSHNDDSDDNLVDGPDNIANPIIAPTSGDVAPSLELPAKNKIVRQDCQEKAKLVYGAKRKLWEVVTVDEFLVFSGLLIHARVDSAWNVPMKELFYGEFANPI
ncbi:hypothetical protein Trydic_g8153 [Trypoxylus dichotomus]